MLDRVRQGLNECAGIRPSAPRSDRLRWDLPECPVPAHVRRSSPEHAGCTGPQTNSRHVERRLKASLNAAEGRFNVASTSLSAA